MPLFRITLRLSTAGLAGSYCDEMGIAISNVRVANGLVFADVECNEAFLTEWYADTDSHLIHYQPHGLPTLVREYDNGRI